MAKYTAEQIAQWFINRAALDVDASFNGEYLTNTKVQKLVYFAQGYYMAFFKKSLFSDKIEAWKYGPVVYDVYQKYNRYERGPIVNIEPVIMDIEDAAFLEFIYEKLGKFTAKTLSERAHSQAPYKNNYKTGEKRVEIPQKEIYDYFCNLKEITKSEEQFRRKQKELTAMAETSYVNSIPGIKGGLSEKEETIEVNWKDEL